MSNLKYFFYVFLIVLVFPPTTRAQTIDIILKKHFDAIGQDKIIKMNTIVVHSKVIGANYEIKFNAYFKRPNKVRSELEYQGLRRISTYNGQEGWIVDPFKGDYEARHMNTEEKEDMLEYSDFDGLLYNYKSKGYKVKLLKSEKQKDEGFYIIKLIKPNGKYITYYLDKISYLIKKKTYKLRIDGNEKDVIEKLDEYRNTDGIMNEHLIIFSNSGRKVKVEKIEYNKELPDELFEKP